MLPEMTWFPAGLGLCKTIIEAIVHSVTQGLLDGGTCDALVLESNSQEGSPPWGMFGLLSPLRQETSELDFSLLSLSWGMTGGQIRLSSALCQCLASVTLSVPFQQALST